MVGGSSRTFKGSWIICGLEDGIGEIGMIFKGSQIGI